MGILQSLRKPQEKSLNPLSANKPALVQDEQKPTSQKRTFMQNLKKIIGACFLLGIIASIAHAQVVSPGTNCPVASTSAFGCIKLGSGWTKNANGSLSPTTSGGGGAALPTQTSNANKILGTDGTTAAWVTKKFVNERPPLPTDDGTIGYGTNQYWNYGGSIWKLQATTTGTANWQRIEQPSQLVMDRVSGALACYGVIKLRSAYTGNAFEVTRASDSTTKIAGFLGNGAADWGTIDTFCSGTTCGVDTWYDQCGTYDATQTTSANRPSVSNDRVGQLRAISTIGGFTQYLTNTSLPITNVRNISLLYVGEFSNSQASNVYWEIGNPTPKYALFPNTGLPGLNTTTGGAFTTAQGPSGPTALLLVTSGAGTVNMKMNDILYTASAPTSSAATGLTLSNGLGYVSYPGYLSMAAFAIYDSSLSTANQDALLQSTYGAFGIQPQARDIIAWIGDSITSGKPASGAGGQDEMFANQLQYLLPHPFTYYNFGHSGDTAAGMRSEVATLISNVKRTNALNIAPLFIGTNDLANNDTAANVYGYLQTLCGTIQSNGFKCIVGTILPRSAGFAGGQDAAGFETARLALNTLIRNGYAGWADGLADIGGDPVVGQASNLNATYYLDNIHPTALGHSFIAANFSAAITPFIK